MEALTFFIILTKLILWYFTIGGLIGLVYFICMYRDIDFKNGYIVGLVSLTVTYLVVSYPVVACEWIMQKLERN